MEIERIDVKTAAFMLGLDYYTVRRRIFRRDLEGGLDDRGRLYTTREAVEEFRERQGVPP